MQMPVVQMYFAHLHCAKVHFKSLLKLHKSGMSEVQIAEIFGTTIEYVTEIITSA